MESNTANDVNANIHQFDDDAGTGILRWRAYLTSDGTQAVELEEIAIEREAIVNIDADNKQLGE